MGTAFGGAHLSLQTLNRRGPAASGRTAEGSCRLFITACMSCMRLASRMPFVPRAGRRSELLNDFPCLSVTYQYL